MAVTHALYGTSMKNLMNGNITDIASTTITLSLMTSDHSFNQAHEYWADVSANQLTTDDYTPGGEALANTALTSTDDVSTIFDADNVQFTAAGDITAYHAVLRASSYLISGIDFDGEQQSVGGEFSVNWNSSGIFWVTVATT